MAELLSSKCLQKENSLLIFFTVNLLYRERLDISKCQLREELYICQKLSVALTSLNWILQRYQKIFFNEVLYN